MSQRKKEIIIVEDTCKDCPYKRYDTDWDAFVCRKTGKIIICDRNIVH